MISRITWTIVFAAVAVGAAAQTNSEPLRLVLGCEEASTPTFRLTVHNVSDAPAAAVIGMILGNDKKYVPGPLSFTVSRPGVADINFDYFDPSVVAIAGRIDPWLIMLPPGAAYSAVVSIPQGLREWFSMPAEVRARFTTQRLGPLNGDVQGLQFIHVWVGALTSDRVRFPNDCGNARQ
jgi:hypothetical protein